MPENSPKAPSETEPAEATETENTENPTPKHDLANEINELREKWLRARADYENLQRRAERDIQTAGARAKARVLERLFDPLEALAKAIQHLQDEGQDAKGLTMVQASLEQVLQDSGCQPIPSLGQPFDVNRHTAVERTPTDEAPEGTILEEIRRGYMLEDKVLRHAVVRVAAPIQTEGAGAPAPPDEAS